MSKSSKSSQSQSTSQTDARLVVDGGSVGNSGAGGQAAGLIAGTGNTINMLDGGLIEAAFAYLTERDASGSRQVDALLDTSRSAVEMSIKNNESSKANQTMIYAVSAVAAVLILKGFK
jgi:hypothetical protein